MIVEDAGRGISESNLRNIFDPFYREVSAEKSNVKGAGLGLAIVRNVVEAHNGNIEVQSEVGHGSKFQITFPEYINGRNDTDYNANIKK